jgi:hypothetical protein
VGSHSGLVHALGERATRKGSRVRISPPPPFLCMLKIILIFLLAFFSNFIWENSHSFLYAHYQNGAISQFVLLRAALFDAVFITLLGALFLKVKYLKDRQWLVLLIGIIAAVLIEWYALAADRWAYNALMPIIPVFNTGLTPTIQLGLLSYLIFKIVIK